jgi:hypothetical protein
MARVQKRRIASDSFTWADTIPELLAEDRRSHPAVADVPHRLLPQPRRPQGSSAPQGAQTNAVD